MLLNSLPFAFVIDLAALASRREYLKLDKWLTDKIREHQVKDLIRVSYIVNITFSYKTILMHLCVINHELSLVQTNNQLEEVNSQSLNYFLSLFLALDLHYS